MTRSDFLRIYPDEIIFDIIMLLHAWLILPDILRKSKAVSNYLGYDAAFAAMMLFFLIALWYAVPILKSLSRDDRAVTSGLGSVLLFVVLVVPLIEGPGLLASHYGIDRGGIEGRFMLIALLMIVIGLVAGNLMPVLNEKVISKIDDPFIGKMISLGLANAGAAAAALLFCFYNLVLTAYFSHFAKEPLYGYYLSLFLSGPVLLRLLMICRSPLRPITMMTGLTAISLLVCLGFMILRPA
ncbi:MAG: hypothetical protein E4G96_08640 [Chrysiogenales bacterium]|nr:MAG: hypothetical protein E4G96_08640 [Chrysiogenales bacterium]